MTSGAAFCEVAQPFHPSAKDTLMTQRQALSHNVTGVKLCGWKP